MRKIRKKINFAGATWLIFTACAITASAEIALDFGGDYNDLNQNNTEALAVGAGDYDFGANTIDDYAALREITDTFVTIDNVNGLTNKTTVFFGGAQYVNFDNSVTAPVVTQNNYKWRGASDEFFMAFDANATTNSGMAFAPYVKKADFLNGFDSIAQPLGFEDAADSFSFTVSGDASMARALVQNGSDWYVSDTTIASGSFTVNGYTEIWHLYEPSGNLFLDEGTLGAGVAGSNLSYIQAAGVLMQKLHFDGTAAMPIFKFNKMKLKVAPSPDQVVTDDFNRADTAWSSKGSDIRADWVVPSANPWRINGNQLEAADANDTSILYNDSLQLSSVADSSFTMSVDVTATTNEQWCGVVFNYQNPANYCMARIKTGTKAYHYITTVDGAEVATSFNYALANFEAGTAYTFTVSGTASVYTIEIKDAGTSTLLNSVTSWTPAATLSGGYAGLLAPSVAAIFDNFNLRVKEVPSDDQFSSAEIQSIRVELQQRRNDFFNSQLGKPFVPAEILVNWKEGRDFTRNYNRSVGLFAMRSFKLNEQLDEANAAIVDMCQYHLDRPLTFFDIDSFPWIADTLVRLTLFYGPNGSIAPGRMTEATYDKVLETMWEWANETAKVDDAELAESKTWWIHDSENHHVQQLSARWLFSKILKGEPTYSNRTYKDGNTPQQKYDSLTGYFREYLRERVAKGMFVEIDSPGYSIITMRIIYSLYDFGDDALLRTRAKDFIDLFWVLWAEEQLEGVVGGATTRCYASNAKSASGGLIRASWYVAGPGMAGPNEEMLCFVTTTWQIPDMALQIAYHPQARGEYEIVQRRMGLALDGYYTPPDYRMRTDFGGILRYTYCTPDFIMGSLMNEARPEEDWAMISSQNRWAGVIFAGDQNARVYAAPYNAADYSIYNGAWSVQSKGTQIMQRLDRSRQAQEWRVFFSKAGLSVPVQSGRWVFAEAPHAYVGVCVVNSNAAFSEEVDPYGRWLVCDDIDSPVIIEAARKADYENFAAFRGELEAREVSLVGGKLSYLSLSDDALTFYTDRSRLPEINGSPVRLTPVQVFDSPFVQSKWNSGVVTIQYGASQQVLDFGTTNTLAVDFGGDYNDLNQNNTEALAVGAGDYDFGANTIDDYAALREITDTFVTIDNVNGLTNKTTVFFGGAQYVNFDNSVTAPVVTQNNYKWRGASDEFFMAFDGTNKTSDSGFAVAPYVKKADFLNGFDSTTQSLGFKDAADSVTFSVVSGPSMSRALVQNGSDWYVSDTTIASGSFGVNGCTETWHPYDPSGNLFLDEGNLGAGVAGSTLTDIQAAGVLMQKLHFDGTASTPIFKFNTMKLKVVPSPDQVVTDDFNRADTAWSSKGSDIRADWVVPSANPWRINGNQLEAADANDTPILYNDSLQLSSVEGSSFTMSVDVTATTNEQWCGVIFNYQNPANYCMARIKTGTKAYHYITTVDGAEVATSFNYALANFEAGTAYTFTVSGTASVYTIEIKDAGTSTLLNPVTSWTPAATLSGGYAGLLAPSGAAIFDNFSLRVWVSAAAGTYDDWISGFSVGSQTNLDDWISGFSLGSQTNLLDDFDADGLNNLVEYGLGGDPTTHDAASILPVSYLDDAGASNRFAYVYNRRLDAGMRGLTYTVECNTNLASTSEGWTTNGVTEAPPVGLDADFEEVTATVPADVDQRFMRLQIGKD